MSSVAVVPYSPPVLAPSIDESSQQAQLVKRSDQQAKEPMPTWKFVLLKVSELVIQVFAVIASTGLAEALLPLSFTATALPCVAIGSLVAIALRFIFKVSTPQIAPPKLHDSAPLFPREAPRGLHNHGTNICWLNSLLQAAQKHQGLKSLFKNVPKCIRDFPMAAAILPREIMFPGELTDHALTTVPFNPKMAEKVLPKDFESLTEEKKTLLRQKADEEVFDWILKMPEFIYIPIDQIFSSVPVDDFLKQDLFKNCPEAEKRARLRNAKELVASLRLVNIEEKEVFIERLRLYQSTLTFISSFKNSGLIDLPLKQWMTLSEAPVVPAEWFNALPENKREAARMAIIAQISAIKKDEKIFELFIDSLGFIQTLPTFSSETAQERQTILCYLTTIHSCDDRLDATKFFLKHHHFFLNCEATKKANQSLVVETVNTANLRAVFRANFKHFSPNLTEQCDPAEAYDLMAKFFPAQLHVNMRTTRIYEMEGLPPIADSVGGDRTVKVNPNPGHLKLLLIGENPNLAGMLEHYFDSAIPSDPAKYKDLHGVFHTYPFKREQNQFEAGPQDLMLTISRFKDVVVPEMVKPKDDLSISSKPVTEKPESGTEKSLVPSEKPKVPPKVTKKLNTPVTIQDSLTITTINEGKVGYKLDAFIVHHGLTANSGHYVAYTLEQADNGEIWYEINDSHVRKVEGAELENAKKQAYMTHYSRI